MKKIFFPIIAAMLAQSVVATPLEITPGSLREAVGTSAAGITELTLSGSADARDLAYMATLPALRVVDMSALQIEAVQADTAVLLGRSHFPAATLPAYIFALSKFESVALPASLITIEECAFASAGNLSQVTFGPLVSYIGDWAFYHTALTAVTLPGSTDSIGEGVFADCASLAAASLAPAALSTLPAKTFRSCASLKSITFPASLRSIGAECFMGSGLETLSVPTSVEGIGEYAFSNMSQLAEIDLHGVPTAAGVLYNNAHLTTAAGLTAYPTVGAALCPMLKVDSVMGMSMTSLGDYALAGNRTEKLWFSDKLTYVGSHVLDGMGNLRNIMAYYMHGSVPETLAGAFDGLPGVEQKSLWVDENYEQMWRQQAEWNRFNIIATTASVPGITAEDGALQIDYAWSGDVLTITTSETMTSAMVYTTAGAIVAGSSVQSTGVSLNLAGVGSTVIVVRVTTASGSRTFKAVKRN